MNKNVDEKASPRQKSSLWSRDQKLKLATLLLSACVAAGGIYGLIMQSRATRAVAESHFAGLRVKIYTKYLEACNLLISTNPAVDMTPAVMAAHQVIETGTYGEFRLVASSKVFEAGERVREAWRALHAHARSTTISDDKAKGAKQKELNAILRQKRDELVSAFSDQLKVD